MNTTHEVFFSDARNMKQIKTNTIDLVVTSPPYPMIQMWDKAFAAMNPQVSEYLQSKQGNKAFEAMHAELDKVWEELKRVVKPSGFVCINIGDATRSIGKNFQLYPNHTRIMQKMIQLRKARNRATRMRLAGQNPTTAAQVAAADGA